MLLDTSVFVVSGRSILCVSISTKNEIKLVQIYTFLQYKTQCTRFPWACLWLISETGVPLLWSVLNSYKTQVIHSDWCSWDFQFVLKFWRFSRFWKNTGKFWWCLQLFRFEDDHNFEGYLRCVKAWICLKPLRFRKHLWKIYDTSFTILLVVYFELKRLNLNKRNMFASLKISAIVNIDDVVFIKRCLQFKASNDFEVWITIGVCPVDYILTFFKLKNGHQ